MTFKLHGSLLALCLTLGCGDDDVGPEPDASLAHGPQYAVFSLVWSADFSEQNGLLWIVDDLAQGTLRAQDAIEIPGGGTLWGQPGTGEFVVVHHEELTVVKYGAEGTRPVMRGRLGLSGQGITTLSEESMLVLDARSGILFDMASRQALRLRFDTMEIERKYDLSSYVIEGAGRTMLSLSGFRPHGGKYVNSSYAGSVSYDAADARAKLVIYDPATDAMSAVDAPCGGLGYSAPGSAGDLYFATDPWVTSLRAIGQTGGPTPCLARLAKDAFHFDARVVDLDTLTGGPTGGLSPGSSGSAFVRVIDRAAFQPSSAPMYMDAYSAPIWQIWRITLDGSAPAQRVELPLTTGGVKVIEVDDQAYENDSSADYATTTLVRTTGEGAPARALTMPGITWGIVRLR